MISENVYLELLKTFTNIGGNIATIWRIESYDLSFPFLISTDILDFNTNISRNKSRKRKIIWFTPRYISNVSTNISTGFLVILDRQF